MNIIPYFLFPYKRKKSSSKMIPESLCSRLYVCNESLFEVNNNCLLRFVSILNSEEIEWLNLSTTIFYQTNTCVGVHCIVQLPMGNYMPVIKTLSAMAKIHDGQKRNIVLEPLHFPFTPDPILITFDIQHPWGNHMYNVYSMFIGRCNALSPRTTSMFQSIRHV